LLGIEGLATEDHLPRGGLLDIEVESCGILVFGIFRLQLRNGPKLIEDVQPLLKFERLCRRRILVSLEGAPHILQVDFDRL
jgi:hypothetical protein